MDGTLAAFGAWSPSFLAQADAPSLAGRAPAGGATTAAPGTEGSAGPRSAGADPASSTLMYLLPLILVVWVVMMMMGQRRDNKKKQSMLGGLKKHDRVQTSGGIIGSIVEIKPDLVVLKVDEQSNTRVTFAKSAIVGVLRESTTSTNEASKDGGTSKGS